MDKEIKYKDKIITKKHLSGMFEYYSDKQKRFLKFDKLANVKSSIDKEEIKESIKPKTQKIKLSEVRQLVRKIIKEEQSKDNLEQDKNFLDKHGEKKLYKMKMEKSIK